MLEENCLWSKDGAPTSVEMNAQERTVVPFLKLIKLFSLCWARGRGTAFPFGLYKKLEEQEEDNNMPCLAP